MYKISRYKFVGQQRLLSRLRVIQHGVYPDVVRELIDREVRRLSRWIAVMEKHVK